VRSFKSNFGLDHFKQHRASDLLCAEHSSKSDHTLHKAACHACMFIPETSCERGNRYLDRSMLVRTVERDDLAFFARILSVLLASRSGLGSRRCAARC
jgi:hypothetical protein